MHILLFSRDLGGTNQLVALNALLAAAVTQGADAIPADLREGLELSADMPTTLNITIVAKDYARQCWRKDGVAYLDWDELVASGSASGPAARAADALARVGPDMLITATSDVDDRTDIYLWRAAREAGIPSIAFVDHGVSLRERFTDDGGRMVTPDRIFLPHADVHAEMQRICGPECALSTCEDLHLLRLPLKAAAVTRAMIAAQRKSLGLAEQDNGVLFASEPRREISAAGRAFGVYEDEALAALVAHVQAGGTVPGAGKSGRTVLVVRRHPKDSPGKYARFIAAHADICVLDANPDPLVSILAADVIVGMDSTLLYEAHAIGRPVLSLEGRSLFVAREGRRHWFDLEGAEARRREFSPGS